jgi:ribosomal protein L11 methyltransferase
VIRLALRVRRADAELALAEILELVPAGVEEVDRGEEVEYAVYGAPGELPDLPDLQAAVGAGLVAVSTRAVADDWGDAWKRFHVPITVGGRVHVRPPWSPPCAGPQTIEVVIDPGQAFGTGAHATTRLCLELLLELPAHGSLLDVGCGSGVLAIAAAKLGFAPVVAVDHDAAAVEAAVANARANGVELEVRRADIRRDSLPGADVVVANLVGPLVRAAGPRLAGAPVLVVSGLLTREVGEVVSELEQVAGLPERRRRAAGEWAAVRLGGSA